MPAPRHAQESAMRGNPENGASVAAISMLEGG